MILQRLPGMRNRLRITILLAFVFVATVLIFPFSEHHRLVNVLTFQVETSPAPPPVFKNEINLEDTVAQFQQEFYDEHDALGKEDTAGKVYGNTLDKLVDAGNRPAHYEAALNTTDLTTPWTNATLYTYNPYPDYNSKTWKASNQGRYVACPGPDGQSIPDATAFRGKSECFHVPPIGSYDVLNIDNALCFDRETRLGMFADEGGELALGGNAKSVDWDSVNWHALQESCYKTNLERFEKHDKAERLASELKPAKTRREESAIGEDDRDRRSHNAKAAVNVTRSEHLAAAPTPATRTALLLRAYSGKQYTENDKQNIRSLVSELALRSGGEYQVFLLVQIKDGLPLTQESLHASLPKEFWDMAVIWNDQEMADAYPLIPPQINNVHQSQWFSVQKFSMDYPDFDYYWNWELDSRYTGQLYDLLEKLGQFAQKQPRRGLWERNERYYIPSVHGDYDTTFRKSVEEISGDATIWGAAPFQGVDPVGPPPPVADPKEDNYKWGVGEEADYISLGPLFNPVGASWVDGNGVWGYGGSDFTPRRATIGTQSRCSRKLLHTMHAENVKGNHVGSEMTPQTVAFLHGLKGVYAPIPVFFDREWSGPSLNKWFNPGPKGQSGSSPVTPYGWGLEARFEGSTWYYRTTLPMRLYNNFLGWEDTGIGGAEWEKSHGRPCLPPILLHPIKDVAKTPSGYKSISELPYR